MQSREVEAVAILKKYSLGTVLSIENMSDGYINNNWRVRTESGMYVLRATPSYRMRAELLFEHAFLRELAKRCQYHVPIPVLTKAGSTLCEHDETLYWMYRYLPGKPEARTSPAHLKQIAKMMASLHSAAESISIEDTKRWPTALDSRRLLLDLRILSLKLRFKSSESKQFFTENIAEIRECLRVVDTTGHGSLRRIPIHADIYNANMLFEKGKLTGIIDFDNSRVDTAIHDIACFLHTACRNGHKIDLPKAKLFLTEYRKHRPLSRQEVRYFADIAIVGFAGAVYFFTQSLARDPENANTRELLIQSKASAIWCKENRTKIIAALV